MQEPRSEFGTGFFSGIGGRNIYGCREINIADIHKDLSVLVFLPIWLLLNKEYFL